MREPLRAAYRKTTHLLPLPYELKERLPRRRLLTRLPV